MISKVSFNPNYSMIVWFSSFLHLSYAVSEKMSLSSDLNSTGKLRSLKKTTAIWVQFLCCPSCVEMMMMKKDNTWSVESTFHLWCVFQSFQPWSAGQVWELCWCCCCTDQRTASLSDMPKALVGSTYRTRGRAGESSLQQWEENTRSTRLTSFFLGFVEYL